MKNSICLFLINFIIKHAKNVHAWRNTTFPTSQLYSFLSWPHKESSFSWDSCFLLKKGEFESDSQKCTEWFLELLPHLGFIATAYEHPTKISLKQIPFFLIKLIRSNKTVLQISVFRIHTNQETSVCLSMPLMMMCMGYTPVFS